jgi:thiamine-monophosphate kinase
MAVEGVHFKREWSSLAQIGAKVTAANLADIYAMGAHPKYLVVTAALPKDFGVNEITELAQGIKAEADLVGAVVVGGDLSSSPVLTISITAIGDLSVGSKAITRSGARVGDQIILSELPGKSAAGLAGLQVGAPNKFLGDHQKPEVNYSRAEYFAQCQVNSMIDISDGLLSESAHIAKDSSVKLEIDSKLLTASPLFSELSEAANVLKANIWEWILAGGEDHVFLATTSNAIPERAIVIGTVVKGEGVEVLGISTPATSGWTHFN